MEIGISLEGRKAATLESIKYLVNFVFDPGLVDETISRIAEECRELGVSYEEVLKAIKEAKEDLRSGKIARLISDDPVHEEAEEIFKDNILPFSLREEGPEMACVHATSDRARRFCGGSLLSGHA